MEKIKFLFLYLSLVSWFLVRPVFSNPTGGVVAGGAATISPSGSTLTINQTSARAIINWQTFNIGKNELTAFVQPSAAAATLNRVAVGNPSMISGFMNANGHVFLINPSGIVFGKSAVVNVGGLVASTLDLSPGDQQTFLNANTPYFFNFQKVPGVKAASVINQGTIVDTSGNDLTTFYPLPPGVTLIGSSVKNSGIIMSPTVISSPIVYGGGNVNLMAAEGLSMQGDFDFVDFSPYLYSGTAENTPNGSILAPSGSLVGQHVRMNGTVPSFTQLYGVNLSVTNTPGVLNPWDGVTADWIRSISPNGGIGLNALKNVTIHNISGGTLHTQGSFEAQAGEKVIFLNTNNQLSADSGISLFSNGGMDLGSLSSLKGDVLLEVGATAALSPVNMAFGNIFAADDVFIRGYNTNLVQRPNTVVTAEGKSPSPSGWNISVEAVENGDIGSASAPLRLNSPGTILVGVFNYNPSPNSGNNVYVQHVGDASKTMYFAIGGNGSNLVFDNRANLGALKIDDAAVPGNNDTFLINNHSAIGNLQIQNEGNNNNYLVESVDGAASLSSVSFSQSKNYAGGLLSVVANDLKSLNVSAWDNDTIFVSTLTGKLFFFNQDFKVESGWTPSSVTFTDNN